jgi:hypothetical protein
LSKPNLELDAIASRPNVGLGVDLSRSNIEVDAVVSSPTWG